GQAFADVAKRRRRTLLARWDEGDADPWLVLTDLPPGSAAACWYGLRAWVEQGVKRLKSGGWGWQPRDGRGGGRAERVWRVLAVGRGGCRLVGGEAESEVPVQALELVPQPARGAVRRQPAPRPPARPAAADGEAGRGPVRRVSVFVLGRVVIVNTLVRAGRLRLGRALPEPWPTQAPAARARASPAA